MKFLVAIVLSVGFAFAGHLENMLCDTIEKAWLNRNDPQSYSVYIKEAINLLKKGANPLEVCKFDFREFRGQIVYRSDTPYAMAIRLSVMPVIKFIFEEMKISPQQVYPSGWRAPINSLPCDVKVVKYFLDKGLDPNYVVRDAEGFPIVQPFLPLLVKIYDLPPTISHKEENKIRRQCRYAIELVLKRGADPNMPVSLKSGSTVLYYLRKENDPYNVYGLFVKYGAKENIKNKLGETPKDRYYGKAE